MIFQFGSCGLQNTAASSSSSETDTNSDEYNLDLYDFVNNELSKVTSSDMYANASVSERKELLSETLTSLENDGYITNLYYSEEDAMYTFQYSDGVLGGIQLSDNNYKIGDMPIN